MDYLTSPRKIPNNQAIMANKYDLFTFFGKLWEVAADYCKFDKTKIMPVLVECPDESQRLKTLYCIATFGMFPFAGGKLGAELDTCAIGPASHHAENLVYIMGSHTGYDSINKKWGSIYREKEGDYSTCCGKLAGILGPYLDKYEDAKRSIKYFIDEGRVLLKIPNRFLEIRNSCESDTVELRLKSSLIKDSLESEAIITAESPGCVIFEIHPDLQLALEDKNRKITHDPTPIGDDLNSNYLKFHIISSDQFSDGISERLYPLMHQIVASLDYPPIVTIANVNTWIEFNRFVDAIHAIPDVLNKGIFAISGLTVDLYLEKESSYSNIYYPQYAFFKPSEEKEGIVMGTSEANNLLNIYAPIKDMLSLDRIIEKDKGVIKKIGL
ncbi:MAG: hypothetical protein KKI12_14245 [Proteobacteria bacterium]|nr:hypothetical protein [Pseudomonadota bacterium]MBU4259723.1 hypothetical protein [Pseudomonadota bacterium]MBU4289317.1 hypothetical protein [Pseudomonadota bacterium]MBU4414286.1 hypothetical protein [Pseudomonadota bacterium]MBU4503585.1 hypothetical protein [Pseudomonadota bacterium]